jgi:hypothetical protein
MKYIPRGTAGSHGGRVTACRKTRIQRIGRSAKRGLGRCAREGRRLSGNSQRGKGNDKRLEQHRYRRREARKQKNSCDGFYLYG